MTKGTSGTISDVDRDQISDTVFFDFGDVINTPATNGSDYIVIEVVAMVLNVGANTGGKLLINVAEFTYARSTTITSTLELTIVEPVLVQTALWNATSGQAGDVLKCTITISHAPTSLAPALFPDVYVQLSPYMDYQPALVTSSILPMVAPKNTSLQSSWSHVSSITRLPLGDTLIVTFSVILNVTTRAGSSLPTSVISLYTSSSDVNSTLGRSNQVTPSNLRVDILPFPVSNITLGSTSDPLVPWGYVTQGEGVTYLVNITVPKGTTLNVRIVVQSPRMNGLVRLTAVEINTFPSYMTTVGYSAVLSDSNSDLYLDLATITMSALINNPTGSSNVWNFFFFFFFCADTNSYIEGPKSACIGYSGGCGAISTQPSEPDIEYHQPIQLLQW